MTKSWDNVIVRCPILGRWSAMVTSWSKSHGQEMNLWGRAIFKWRHLSRTNIHVSHLTDLIFSSRNRVSILIDFGARFYGNHSLKSNYVRISCSLIWTRRFIYYRAKPIVTGNTVQEDTRSTPFSLTSCEGAIWTRCGRWPFASGNISPCRRQLYMYLFSSFTRWPLQVLLTSHMTKHFFQATRSPETVTYDFPATGYLWC